MLLFGDLLDDSRYSKGIVITNTNHIELKETRLMRRMRFQIRISPRTAVFSYAVAFIRCDLIANRTIRRYPFRRLANSHITTEGCGEHASAITGQRSFAVDRSIIPANAVRLNSVHFLDSFWFLRSTISHDKNPVTTRRIFLWTRSFSLLPKLKVSTLKSTSPNQTGDTVLSVWTKLTTFRKLNPHCVTKQKLSSSARFLNLITSKIEARLRRHLLTLKKSHVVTV